MQEQPPMMQEEFKQDPEHEMQQEESPEGKPTDQQPEIPTAQREGEQKHYFDSIDTDEFVMPNLFEVEIRLADN